MTISSDTRSLALEALELLLEKLREQRLDYHYRYIKGDWRGDLHRHRMASRIRSVRAAMRELDELAVVRAA